MRRIRRHEEHTNHERWAIPYGDLLTLLLAFFVVMYSISSVNAGKYRVLSNSLYAAFRGQPRSLTPIQIGRTQIGPGIMAGAVPGTQPVPTRIANHPPEAALDAAPAPVHDPLLGRIAAVEFPTKSTVTSISTCIRRVRNGARCLSQQFLSIRVEKPAGCGRARIRRPDGCKWILK